MENRASAEQPATDLAQRLLAGDASVTEEVRRWVRGASSPYRGLLSDELEDLEQEILLSLTETLRERRFEGRSSLATYVRRSTHYKCVDRLRASRRREFVELADEHLVSQADNPFDKAAERETMKVALLVLARMSEECRELWRLLQRGHSYAQMSEELGVQAGTLRVRMLRCRRKAIEERERLLSRPE